MIGIIDYGAGNINSVEKALHFLGEETFLSGDPKTLLGADRLILPGVGAFGEAMERLRLTGLDDLVREAYRHGLSLLGICLGLQLLFSESEESPGVKGIGVLDGTVRKFPADAGWKIPHMGWNSIHIQRPGTLFDGMRDPYVYFVHSYYLEAADEEIVSATADYAVPFHAAVEKDRLYACQFHPEKSGRAGLTILKNFCRRDPGERT